MTLFSAARNVAQLVIEGEGRTVVRNLPYLIKTKWRGVDLGHIPAERIALPPGGHDCTDSGGPDLAIPLRSLRWPATAGVLDVGCGKGGALFTLAEFFAHVDGLEYDAELCRIARQNRERLGLQARVSIWEGDARTFQQLDRFEVFYLANPFDHLILGTFLANVGASWRHQPRTLRLLYRNASRAAVAVLANHGWRAIQWFSHTRHPIVAYTLHEESL